MEHAGKHRNALNAAPPVGGASCLEWRLEDREVEHQVVDDGDGYGRTTIVVYVNN